MAYDPTRNPLHAFSISPTAPARRMAVVTPSDTVDLDPYAKCLWAYVPADVATGVATVRVTPVGAALDADTVDVKMTPGLQPLPPVQVRRVWATGTTAGVIIYALADR